MIDPLLRVHLIQTIQRFINGDYETEEEVDEMIECLEANIPTSSVTDYIFSKSRPDDTAEMMLERMLREESIHLPYRFIGP